MGIKFPSLLLLLNLINKIYNMAFTVREPHERYSSVSDNAMARLGDIDRIYSEIVGDDTEQGYILTFIGKSAGNETPDYSSNNVVADADSLETAVGKVDTKIGANPTANSRTNNPIVADNTVAANIEALDDAIGSDPTANSRTNNPIVVGNTVVSNIEALDDAIGSSAEKTSTTYISDDETVYDSLSVLDAGVTTLNTRATHEMDSTNIVKYPLMCTVVYDFSSDGSGTTVTLNGGTAVLPDNAVVVNVLVDVLTDFDSTSGTSDVKFSLPTDGDLTGTITADGTNAGLVDGTPDWSATNMVKTTAARAVQLESTVDDITAGKAQIYIFYVVSQ